MSKEKHGLLGSIIKIIMVVIFTAIGAAILTTGILGLTKWKGEFPTWIPACNTAFGACLLTAPFFLSEKRSAINIVKIAMSIVFVVIGILFIVAGALGLSVYKADFAEYKWVPIVNLVFGCLLFTSVYFLKKSLMGGKKKEK